jgi:hypothetical protein
MKLTRRQLGKGELSRAHALDQTTGHHYWKREDREARSIYRLEPGIPRLASKFASPIATLMQGDIIGSAPHPAMLRNGRDQQAAGFQGAPDLGKNGLIVRDVLQHVEGANEIQYSDEMTVPGIELKQLGIVTMPGPSRDKPPAVQFGAGNLGRWQGLSQRCERIAGATTQFENAPRISRVSLHQPANELVSALEPEAAFFHLGELRKVLEIDPFIHLIERRSEQGKSFALGKSIAT